MAKPKTLTSQNFVHDKALLATVEIVFTLVSEGKSLVSPRLIQFGIPNRSATLPMDSSGSASVERLKRHICERMGSMVRPDTIQAMLKEFIEHLGYEPFEPKDAAKQFLTLVLERVTRPKIYIAPNFLIQFRGATDFVRIGPVKAMTQARLFTEFPYLYPEVKREIENGDLLFLDLKSQATPIEVFWIVEVAASQENLSLEAKWLIHVAASLLRLRTHATEQPVRNKPEADPVLSRMSGQQNHYIAQGRWVAFNGETHMPHYTVSERTTASLAAEQFSEKADLIFERAIGSIAERVARGLAWWTHARQAQDPAERLLFFFSAIEALFAVGKNVPIVQTICRHVAVVLTNDVGYRARISTKVAKLYDTRSRLVHDGDRSMPLHEVLETEEIVERVFARVFEHCDFRMSHREFSEQLVEAGYGSAWRNLLPHETEFVP